MGVLVYPRHWSGIKPPPSVGVQSGHPLAHGLLARWTFAAGGGLTIPSISGQYPGTITNPTNSPNGWISTPDGSGWNIGTPSVGDSTYLTVTNAPFPGRCSYEALWIAPTFSVITNGIMQTTNGTISDTTVDRSLYTDGTGLLTAFIFDGIVRTAAMSTPLATGQRYHAVMTVDGTNLTLYLNGLQVAQTAAGEAYTGYTTPSFYFGAGQRAGGGVQGIVGGTLLASGLWNRALTPSEVLRLYVAPWGLFTPPMPTYRVLLSTAAVQLAVPVSDVSAGGWTPSTGTDLYAMLDETVADDTDYIQSATGPANAEAKVRLGPLTDPNSSTGHIISYRFDKTPAGSGRGDLTVTLYAADGTTSIASNTHTDVGTTVIAGSFTLTGPQADAIPSADYATGLVIGVKANAP